MELDELKEILAESLKELLDKDHHILDVNANERSISHKLACYLSTRIPERSSEPSTEVWDVDAEYNRNVDKKKSVNNCSSRSWDTTYPDIIIHRRGLNNDSGSEDNNLLIIEMKKDERFNLGSDDAQKIMCFIKSSPYHYKFGLFINLNYPKGKPELTWFERDNSIGINAKQLDTYEL